MGYTGSRTIKDLQENGKFIKITNAGLRESHAHDVYILIIVYLIKEMYKYYSKQDKNKD